MELTNEELEIVLSALSDQIMADDLPNDEMKKIMKLHRKIGTHLFPVEGIWK